MLDYRWSRNPGTYQGTVTPNWYRTHTVPQFGHQGSWIISACHYTRQSYAAAKWVELTWWISWSQDQLDRRSKFRFYLCLFFDLFNVALINSFTVYKKLQNGDLTLKEFNICITLKLIASLVRRKLSCLNHRPSKLTKAQRPGSIPPSHMSVFLETRRLCTVCFQAGKENRTFVTCSLCDAALCLQKERNC